MTFPTWYTAVWTTACACMYLAIVIPTIISITRSSHHAWSTKTLWIALALLLPPLALLLWLLAGRSRTVSSQRTT